VKQAVAAKWRPLPAATVRAIAALLSRIHLKFATFRCFDAVQ
jgi:hypothetical protein